MTTATRPVVVASGVVRDPTGVHELGERGARCGCLDGPVRGAEALEQLRVVHAGTSSHRRRRLSSARCCNDFTAPTRLPRMSATCSRERSAVTRSATTARWSGGSDASIASAHSAPDVGQRLVFDVAGCADLDVDAERGRLRTALPTAGVVDQDPVGDGEEPGPEVGFVTGELRQPVEHPEEHLAGEVLGFTGALRAQVAEDAGGVVVVEPTAGPRLVRERPTTQVVERDLTDPGLAAASHPTGIGVEIRVLELSTHEDESGRHAHSAPGGALSPRTRNGAPATSRPRRRPAPGRGGRSGAGQDGVAGSR